MMKKLLEQYRPGTIRAMICGIITIGFGIAAGVTGQRTQMFLIFLMILLNFALHIDSFYTNIRDLGRRQDMVFAMVLVEGGYLLFLVSGFFRPMTWETYITFFAAYVWVNAASLAAMPIRMAQILGIIAMVSGVLVYASSGGGSGFRTFAIALCMVINGSERFFMSVKAKKKK